MKTFSLITVCFNAEALIKRTLDSVAAQSFTNYEYIIIDGKSADQTLSIVKQYGGVVTKCVSERDTGIYDAMNKGLALAQGQYVWFLNAGDELANADTLAHVAAVAADADVIYGDTVITNSRGQEIGLRRHRPPQKLTWRSFELGMLVCHQAFVAKRTLCQPYNLRYRYSADFDWCICVLRSSTQVVDAQTVLARFVEGGATAKNKIPSLCERFRIMCCHYGTFTAIVRHVQIALRRLL